MCKHATITHFSQISLWNKECKDVPLSLSWHYAPFIPFYILSLLLKAPLFPCAHREFPRFTITYFHRLQTPNTLKNPHQQTTQFESRNEIQLHHRMSRWPCVLTLRDSSKHRKAGQSRWSSSHWNRLLGSRALVSSDLNYPLSTNS